MRLPTTATCPACDGEGQLHAASCLLCGGAGIIAVNAAPQDNKLTPPPGIWRMNNGALHYIPGDLELLDG